MKPKNNRRMTLGSVGLNQPSTSSNRKSDIGLPSKTRSSRGRASMIPRVGGDRENTIPMPPPSGNSSSRKKTNSRRSSVGGGDRRQSIVPPPNATTTVKTDPRPVSEKVFQQECIRDLHEFLEKNGYEYRISPKSLARPSGKDFCNIATFLLRMVDPSFQQPQQGSSQMLKFEDEVALNFKAMGYPFPVSKTALIAAGTPHTWPTLLAALTWLMEHIQLVMGDQQKEPRDEIAAIARDPETEPFESLEEMEIQTDKAFFAYLSASYSAFLKGDQERTEQLELALSDRFEQDDAVIEAEVERVTDLNAAIVEKINRLKHESEDLPAYAKKREDYATDLEQFHDLIRQLDEHKVALEQRVKERTAELEQTNQKLERTTKFVEKLKVDISKQEFTVEDIRRIESDQKVVEEAIERAMAVNDTRRKDLQVSEKQLQVLFNQLESVIADYSARLGELALIPDIAEEDIEKMKIKLNKSKALEADTREMLGVDIKSSLIPYLQRRKSEYAEKVTISKRNYHEALEVLDRSEVELTEAAQKLKIVEEKTEKCEETMASEREAHEAKLAVRAREVSAIENMVASLRDPIEMEERMAALERQCTELEATRMKLKEEYAVTRKSIQDKIEHAYAKMEEQDAYFQKKAEEVEAYVTKKLDSLGDLKVPISIETSD